MDNKLKNNARIEFIKKLLEQPKGTIADYYHGYYIYRIEDYQNNSKIERNKKENEVEH